VSANSEQWKWRDICKHCGKPVRLSPVAGLTGDWRWVHVGSRHSYCGRWPPGKMRAQPMKHAVLPIDEERVE